jgi:hypothetical protein
MNSIGDLNFNYDVTDANCLGLAAGTYSYQQMIDAIIALLCELNSSVVTIENNITNLQNNNVLEWNNIVLSYGWEAVDLLNNPPQYAIQNGLMYLKGNIHTDEITVLTQEIWGAVPMTGITRVIDTMCYENFSTVGAVKIRIQAGTMSYIGPVEVESVLMLDSIPAIRLTN